MFQRKEEKGNLKKKPEAKSNAEKHIWQSKIFSQAGEKKEVGEKEWKKERGEGDKRNWQLHRDIKKLILGQFKHWLIEESKSPWAFCNSPLFMDERPWGVKYFHDSEA